MTWSSLQRTPKPLLYFCLGGCSMASLHFPSNFIMSLVLDGTGVRSWAWDCGNLEHWWELHCGQYKLHRNVKLGKMEVGCEALMERGEALQCRKMAWHLCGKVRVRKQRSMHLRVWCELCSWECKFGAALWSRWYPNSTTGLMFLCLLRCTDAPQFFSPVFFCSSKYLFSYLCRPSNSKLCCSSSLLFLHYLLFCKLSSLGSNSLDCLGLL